MKPIDLGRKSEDCGLPPASPVQANLHYPSIYIDGDDDLCPLPDSGVLKIAFKVTSRTLSERAGKKTCSIALDVLRILDVEADVSAKKDSGSDALDALADDEAGE